MPTTINSLASNTNGNATSPSVASSSFVPTANEKIYAFGVAQNDGDTLAHVWACSGGGLDWEPIVVSAEVAWDGAGSSFDVTVVLFEAVAPSSPSSMTVTLANHTPPDGCYISTRVFEVVGGELIQVKVNATTEGGGASESHTSTPLDANATNGNLSVACLGVAHDGGSGPGTPADWDPLGTVQSQGYTHANVYSRDDFTGTSVVWSNLVGGVGSCGAAGSIVMEFGGVTQDIYPDSDVTRIDWVNESAATTNLWQSIDEDSVSDSDYITVSV